MGKDCNILHANCILPLGMQVTNLEIRNGKIVAIDKDENALSSCECTIDARDFIVCPGMIDSHVHIRGGEFSYREDFFSGSVAAITSGVTTILEMPGCARPAYNEENFMRRVYEVKAQGAINIGLYGAAGYDNLEMIPKLKELGAIGFKTFQMAPVKGREKEFYGMCAENYSDMVNVMREVKKTGLTLTVHCESQEIIDGLVPEMKQKYPNNLRGFIESRPSEAEVKSVELTVKAAKETGCRTIIAHVSCPKSMEIICEAKKEGYEVYAETCAHYLYFDKEEMISYGAFARMKPPFRSREEVEKMDQLYHQGCFDVTGSDHAPYTIEEKQKFGADIWNSYDGLYGLEMTLPLLLNLVDDEKISLLDIVYSFSQKPAQIFNIQGKGRIQEGYDADLVLIKKRKKPGILHKEDLKCKCKDAAVIYDGIPLKYQIAGTILDGELVFDGNTVDLKKGSSHIIHY